MHHSDDGPSRCLKLETEKETDQTDKQTQTPQKNTSHQQCAKPLKEEESM